jgi:ubiquinone/menaquinone biosynthesis C-methylase UbiE
MKKTSDPVFLTIDSYNYAFKEFNEKTRNVSSFPGLQEELDLFISMLDGKRVLDIGFGSGRDTLYFLMNKLNVYGIELTMNFIKSLKLVVDSPTSCMDMRKLAFSCDSFDGLWACASLLHLPMRDIPSTLDEFHRVLTNKGTLYISVKEGQGDEWIQEGHIGMPRYFNYFSMDALCELITKHGFGIVYNQRKLHQSGTRSWLSVYSKKVGS